MSFAWVARVGKRENEKRTRGDEKPQLESGDGMRDSKRKTYRRQKGNAGQGSSKERNQEKKEKNPSPSKKETTKPYKRGEERRSGLSYRRTKTTAKTIGTVSEESSDRRKKEKVGKKKKKERRGTQRSRNKEITFLSVL